ncbi:MAG: adenylyl-sulfate kinase, partial [Bacillota bacterium]
NTARQNVQLEEIHSVIDASDLSRQDKREEVRRNDVAEVTLKLDKAISYDLAGQIEATSRFVLVDDYEIAGGGIIQQTLADKQSWVRENVMLRNYKWESSIIKNSERAEKYSQKPTLVLITGQEDVGKKPTAKTLERDLFESGRIVYFLGIGNLLYGVDADIKNTTKNHKDEHLRRLAEVSNIILDSGSILIVTAVELSQQDLELIETTVDQRQVKTVWLGDEVTTNIDYDLKISDYDNEKDAAYQIKDLLLDQGVIFKPW